MIKKVNENLSSITISDIENHKFLTKEDLLYDLNKLKEFAGSINENNFAGKIVRRPGCSSIVEEVVGYRS